MESIRRHISAGRRLVGRPRWGDGTSRHGYGMAVIRQCGRSCLYCGRDVGASYESWLDSSVDRVIPKWAPSYPECTDWIHDLANLVTCCRACNEFLNQYKVPATIPHDLCEFFDLRDRVFSEKQEYARKCHARERKWYENWAETERSPSV